MLRPEWARVWEVGKIRVTEPEGGRTMSETLTAVIEPESDQAPPGAGPFYEVINGQVVEPPEMGAFETVFATRLSNEVAIFFRETGSTGHLAVETLFRIQSEPNLQRRPDMAFVSYDRWEEDLPIQQAAWQVVPDLAVEVVSPNDLAVELMDRLDDYFRAGVRLVWVIYPRHGRVFVHTPPKGIAYLDAADTLDGGDVLPGFKLPLAELFRRSAGR
jgi:Uma2 family endonuclease